MSAFPSGGFTAILLVVAPLLLSLCVVATGLSVETLHIPQIDEDAPYGDRYSGIGIAYAPNGSKSLILASRHNASILQYFFASNTTIRIMGGTGLVCDPSLGTIVSVVSQIQPRGVEVINSHSIVFADGMTGSRIVGITTATPITPFSLITTHAAALIGGPCNYTQHTFTNGSSVTSPIGPPDFTFYLTDRDEMLFTQFDAIVSAKNLTTSTFFGKPGTKGHRMDTFNANPIDRLQATTFNPSQMARVGDVLYVAERGMGIVRQINLTSGQASVAVGTFTPTWPPPNCTKVTCTPTTATLIAPHALVALLDHSKKPVLFIGDSSIGVLYRAELGPGSITVIAGQILRPGRVDGGATVSELSSVYQIAATETELYISDGEIRVIKLDQRYELPAQPNPEVCQIKKHCNNRAWKVTGFPFSGCDCVCKFGWASKDCAIPTATNVVETLHIPPTTGDTSSTSRVAGISLSKSPSGERALFFGSLSRAAVFRYSLTQNLTTMITQPGAAGLVCDPGQLPIGLTTGIQPVGLETINDHTVLFGDAGTGRRVMQLSTASTFIAFTPTTTVIAKLVGGNCNYTTHHYVPGSAANTPINVPDFTLYLNDREELLFTQYDVIVSVTNSTMQTFFGKPGVKGSRSDAQNHAPVARLQATTKDPSQMVRVGNLLYVAEAGMGIVREIDLAAPVTDKQTKIAVGTLSPSWPPLNCSTDTPCTVGATIIAPRGLAAVINPSTKETVLFIGDASVGVVYRADLGVGSLRIVAGQLLRPSRRADGNIFTNQIGAVQQLAVSETELFISDGYVRVLRFVVPFDLPSSSPLTRSADNQFGCNVFDHCSGRATAVSGLPAVGCVCTCKPGWTTADCSQRTANNPMTPSRTLVSKTATQSIPVPPTPEPTTAAPTPVPTPAPTPVPLPAVATFVEPVVALVPPPKIIDAVNSPDGYTNNSIGVEAGSIGYVELRVPHDAPATFTVTLDASGVAFVPSAAAQQSEGGTPAGGIDIKETTSSGAHSVTLTFIVDPTATENATFTVPFFVPADSEFTSTTPITITPQVPGSTTPTLHAFVGTASTSASTPAPSASAATEPAQIVQAVPFPNQTSTGSGSGSGSGDATIPSSQPLSVLYGYNLENANDIVRVGNQLGFITRCANATDPVVIEQCATAAASTIAPDVPSTSNGSSTGASQPLELALVTLYPAVDPAHVTPGDSKLLDTSDTLSAALYALQSDTVARLGTPATPTPTTTGDNSGEQPVPVPGEPAKFQMTWAALEELRSVNTGTDNATTAPSDASVKNEPLLISLDASSPTPPTIVTTPVVGPVKSLDGVDSSSGSEANIADAGPMVPGIPHTSVVSVSAVVNNVDQLKSFCGIPYNVPLEAATSIGPQHEDFIIQTAETTGCLSPATGVALTEEDINAIASSGYSAHTNAHLPVNVTKLVAVTVLVPDDFEKRMLMNPDGANSSSTVFDPTKPLQLDITALKCIPSIDACYVSAFQRDIILPSMPDVELQRTAQNTVTATVKATSAAPLKNVTVTVVLTSPVPATITTTSNPPCEAASQSSLCKRGTLSLVLQDGVIPQHRKAQILSAEDAGEISFDVWEVNVTLSELPSYFSGSVTLTLKLAARNSPKTVQLEALFSPSVPFVPSTPAPNILVDNSTSNSTTIPTNDTDEPNPSNYDSSIRIIRHVTSGGANNGVSTNSPAATNNSGTMGGGSPSNGSPSPDGGHGGGGGGTSNGGNSPSNEPGEAPQTQNEITTPAPADLMNVRRIFSNKDGAIGGWHFVVWTTIAYLVVLIVGQIYIFIHRKKPLECDYGLPLYSYIIRQHVFTSLFRPCTRACAGLHATLAYVTLLSVYFCTALLQWFGGEGASGWVIIGATAFFANVPRSILDAFYGASGVKYPERKRDPEFDDEGAEMNNLDNDLITSPSMSNTSFARDHSSHTTLANNSFALMENTSFAFSNASFNNKERALAGTKSLNEIDDIDFDDSVDDDEEDSTESTSSEEVRETEKKPAGTPSSTAEGKEDETVDENDIVAEDVDELDLEYAATAAPPAPRPSEEKYKVTSENQEETTRPESTTPVRQDSIEITTTPTPTREQHGATLQAINRDAAIHGEKVLSQTIVKKPDDDAPSDTATSSPATETRRTVVFSKTVGGTSPNKKGDAAVPPEKPKKKVVHPIVTVRFRPLGHLTALCMTAFFVIGVTTLTTDHSTDQRADYWFLVGLGWIGLCTFGEASRLVLTALYRWQTDCDDDGTNDSGRGTCNAIIDTLRWFHPQPGIMVTTKY